MSRRARDRFVWSGPSRVDNTPGLSAERRSFFLCAPVVEQRAV